MTEVELSYIECWCGLPFALPTRLKNTCLETGDSFHCPLGHKNTYKESRADKYRREAEKLKQRLAHKDDIITRERRDREHAERSAAGLRGHITKLRKRASAGVCPCCNRQFQDLYRHIKTKHPEFSNSETPTIFEVIEGG